MCSDPSSKSQRSSIVFSATLDRRSLFLRSSPILRACSCLDLNASRVIASLAYLVYFIDGYQQHCLLHAWNFNSKRSFSYIGGKALVGMSEVEATIQEMFQAPHIQVMRYSSKLGKIFVTAMVHELYKTGMGETTFEKLAMVFSSLCASNGEQFPRWDTLLRIGCMLGECRNILASQEQDTGYRSMEFHRH